MNDVAKSKIELIENNLHKLARENCPHYVDMTCEKCDIECPFDLISNFLSHVKRGEKCVFTSKNL